ncbi:MAG: ROK family transcriptional regulator [Muribaculaceae bacterium]|nr:ROK family transcriptional regulator [Muribaculaceae bacterium]
MTHTLLREIETGSKSALMKKRIISYYIHNGNSTINDLALVLDLSIPTVTKFIDEMCASGLLSEYGKLERSGGRHPSLYGLNPTSGYFIGVDVRRYSMNIGLINFSGEMIENQINLPYVFENSEAGLRILCNQIRDFIDALDIDSDKILNICVNVSGRVNPDSGYSYSWFNFGEDPLAQIMSEMVGYPVCVDNDTRSMTYGEFMKGTAKSHKNVLYINASWGIGLGMVIDGKIYLGKSGFAGEFGHVPVYDNQVICHCGKKGCLETEASGYAVYRKLIERVNIGEISVLSDDIKEGKDITLEKIVKAVNDEDILCIELIEEVGINLGKAIAGLINIFNPEMVVIGGLLSMTGDYLIQPMKTAIRKYSLNLVNKDTIVCASSLRAKAGMIGACMVARSRLFEDSYSSIF